MVDYTQVQAHLVNGLNNSSALARVHTPLKHRGQLLAPDTPIQGVGWEVRKSFHSYAMCYPELCSLNYLEISLRSCSEMERDRDP